MELSLFYFADDTQNLSAGRYEFLLEGARFGDENGFAAVWTPERHFHRFGGNYPNSAVTSAALAAVTRRIQIRAGSVVAPLHELSQIAADWTAVDRLSGGRVGISLASGWNRGDFVLRPDAYERRGRSTGESIGALRRMWTHRTLPVWISTGGTPDTVRAAGRAGAGVLTHLASQSPDDLAARIGEYRGEYRAAGHQGRGHVVLMMHTFIGDDLASVEEQVREPLENYLMSAMNLFQGNETPRSIGRAKLAIRPACERYLRQRQALFGSVDDAWEVVRRYRDIGVDEIACLIDFGVPAEAALRGLRGLAELRNRVSEEAGVS